jgi:integrase
MTRIKLKYVQAFVDRRTGGVYYYFRRAGFPLVRLPGLPGSDAFLTAYRTALAGEPLAIGLSRSKTGTVSWAIASYYSSTEFKDALAPGTQMARRAILEKFRAVHGDWPLTTLPQKFLVLMLGKLKPNAQRNWLKALRGLMQFALSREMIAADPTAGIRLAKVRSHGFHSWSEDEIAAYEACHPVGTKARTALALLLFTAQRRGDVVKMGRQHVRDGVLHLRQQKTGTALMIPVHRMLMTVFDRVPADQLTFLVTRTGRPYSGSNFSAQFRVWCDEAGLPPECSAHGLRKAACRRLAEAGCSANEIAAISGHASLREIERYTRAADQARLARNAMARAARYENETGPPTVKTPEPFDKSGS